MDQSTESDYKMFGDYNDVSGSTEEPELEPDLENQRQNPKRQNPRRIRILNPTRNPRQNPITKLALEVFYDLDETITTDLDNISLKEAEQL